MDLHVFDKSAKERPALPPLIRYIWGMRTKIFALDDDALDTWFSEEAPARPLNEFAENHGQLVFDGSMDRTPVDGNIILLKDDNDDVKEFIVLLQVFRLDHDDPNADLAEVYVHERHFETSPVS